MVTQVLILTQAPSGYAAAMPIITDIDDAVAILQQGGVVAVPTETVYGLAGDASSPLAVRQIYATKGRPAGHPVIVHLAREADLGQYAHVDARAEALAAAFWPGPLTLILHKQPGVPDEVTGGLDTVGIRMPDHPLTQAVISRFGGGIAAPSANRFGRVSPTTAQHVCDEFGDTVHVLDGGPCSVGIESTIVDLTQPEAALLRPGSILPQAIEAIVGPLTTSDTKAPGTLKQHYQPMTSLLLSTNVEADRARLIREGQRVAILAATAPEDHAKHLYAELRRLDKLGVDVLIAEAAAATGLGDAINDRLRRASSQFSTD